MPTAFFTDAAQEIAPITDASQDVLRTGKYFECDKEFTDMSGLVFSVSEAEADAAIEAFAPAPLNLQHTPTVLDGMLGRVQRLWRDGKDILAEYSFPKLLHQHMGGQPVKISSEWDLATKRAVGGALVLNPSVQDAVMMAAFSEGKTPIEALVAFAMTRHNTPEGQTAMQDLHDMAARSGAVCDRTNTAQMSSAAKMASQHESTAVQKIHDIAADHGATCKSGDKPSYLFTEKGETMFEKLKTLFSKAGVPDADINAHLTDAVAEFSAPGMTEAEKAQFSALVADNARMKAEGVAKDAAAFADAQILACRAYPAEKANLVAAFCQAAADDGVIAATVKFSVLESGAAVEKTGTRLDAFRALVEARPSHGLTQEQLKAAAFSGAVLLSAPDEGAAKTEEVNAAVNKLLSASTIGSAILKEKAGK